MITINGARTDCEGITITEYLTAHAYKIEQIVVEYNGEILPKPQYATTTLQDGDVIEVVCFMGGG